MIRIGRCKYNNQGQRSDPSYPGFTPIVVLMKGHNEWGCLGPYELKDDNNVIFENRYQYSKVYQEVPATIQRYSRWDKKIIWNHPKETHYANNQLQPAYWTWREKGMNNQYAVRYPVGFGNMHKCLFAIKDANHINEKMDYIETRMQIYVPLYCELVKKQDKFYELKNRLDNGENLLIIEVDGPHQESLINYQEKYGVYDNFIENDTILGTEENLHIMMIDPKHPFGHGYCLAVALLNLENLVNL